MLNLAELLALRPDLNAAKKILFFQENQLVVCCWIWSVSGIGGGGVSLTTDFFFDFFLIASSLILNYGSFCPLSPPSSSSFFFHFGIEDYTVKVDLSSRK